MVEAIEYVVRTCRARGVTPGIHCSGGAGAARRYQQGFRFMAFRSETSMLQAGIRMEFRAWEEMTRGSGG